VIHTDGIPTIAMRESEPLLKPLEPLVDRDPGDEALVYLVAVVTGAVVGDLLWRVIFA
jgi:hypothetical protein